MDETTISSLLSKLDGEFIFVLLLVGWVTGTAMFTGVVVNVSKQIRRYRESKVSADLVQEMLTRGMSVEQIAVVLQAWSKSHGRLDDKVVQQAIAASKTKPPIASPAPEKMMAGV